LGGTILNYHSEMPKPNKNMCVWRNLYERLWSLWKIPKRVRERVAELPSHQWITSCLPKWVPRKELANALSPGSDPGVARVEKSLPPLHRFLTLGLITLHCYRPQLILMQTLFDP